jgi:hypothetical protein
LITVQEELFGAVGVVTAETVSEVVRGYVDPVNPDLSVVDASKRLA